MDQLILTGRKSTLCNKFSAINATKLFFSATESAGFHWLCQWLKSYISQRNVNSRAMAPVEKGEDLLGTQTGTNRNLTQIHIAFKDV